MLYCEKIIAVSFLYQCSTNGDATRLCAKHSAEIHRLQLPSVYIKKNQQQLL